jgi:hypothetical protein
MAAITLGLAEVEERLQALRRRLNFATAQHSFYLGSSVLTVMVTLLVVTGLRAAPSTFRIMAWGGGAVVMAVGVACVLYARRCWLDPQGVARLADERANLTDRLTTLADLRLRPRPSRLAPVLVAQTLALGSQWQAQRIAPRRIPRSVFLMVASLLALTGTAVTEHDLPHPAPPAASAGREKLADYNKPGEPKPPDASRSAAKPAHDGAQPIKDSGPDASLPGSAAGSSLDRSGEVGTRTQPNQEKAEPGALTDRLQQAIHQAFHPEATDSSQLTSGSSQISSRDGQQPGVPDKQRSNGSGAGRSPAHNDREAAQGKGRDPSKAANGAAQREGASNTGQSFRGDSPGASQGSNPEGLMDADAGNPSLSGGEQPFKLTITSFLRPVEQQGRQPNPARRQTSADRQLADDTLRKATIPPDYEDLVRRVFSVRPMR